MIVLVVTGEEAFRFHLVKRRRKAERLSEFAGERTI